MTKRQRGGLMVYRQTLEAQTAITGIHNVTPDMMFDLGTLILRHQVLFHTKVPLYIIFLATTAETVSLSLSLSFALSLFLHVCQHFI